jgi:Ca2+-transporting ATPase
MALHIIGKLFVDGFGHSQYSILLTFHTKQLFTVLCFSQMGHAHSSRESLLKIPFQINFLGLLLTVFPQLMIIYVPFFNVIFKTQPLVYELILTLLSSSCFWAVEIAKWILRRKKIARRSQNSYVQYYFRIAPD